MGSLWLGVTKSGSNWKVGRKPASSFNTNWATDEPVDAPGSDCAYLDKSANYLMKTDNCKASKSFLCTPIVPNCPDGFEHVPPYKKGSHHL